jgi:hypothetical protein
MLCFKAILFGVYITCVMFQYKKYYIKKSKSCINNVNKCQGVVLPPVEAVFKKKSHNSCLSRLEIHGLRQGAAGPLYDVGGCPNAAPDRLIQRCALHVLGQKAAHKGVPGSVGVHNPVSGQPLRREFQDLTAQGCGSGFNRVSESGSRRAKMTHKSRIFF